jgi:hypothetical protein
MDAALKDGVGHISLVLSILETEPEFSIAR